MPKPGPKPYECIRRAWHSESHVELRRSLIAQMCKVVIDIHKPQTHANKEWQEKLPKVIMRVEEILYSKAKSQVEYLDLNTLQQRMNQAIDTMIGISDGSDDATDGPKLLPCIEAALSLCCQPSTSPTPRCGRQVAGASRRGCGSQVRHRFAGHNQRVTEDARGGGAATPHQPMFHPQMQHVGSVQEQYYGASALMMPPIASGSGQAASIILPQRSSRSPSTPDQLRTNQVTVAFPSLASNPMMQPMLPPVVPQSSAMNGAAECARPQSLLYNVYDWSNQLDAPCSSGSANEVPPQRLMRECGPRMSSERWTEDIDLNRMESSGGMVDWAPGGEAEVRSFSQSSPDSSSKNTAASPSHWSGPACEASKDGDCGMGDGGGMACDGAASVLSAKDEMCSPEVSCPAAAHCSSGLERTGWAPRRICEKFDALLCMISQEGGACNHEGHGEAKMRAEMVANVFDPVPGKDEDTIFLQQRWLIMIRHFASCLDHQGACTMPDLCKRGSSLKAHMSDCSARDCKYPFCAPSKALFDHFSRCIERCPVCAHIRAGGSGLKRARYV